LIYLKGTYSTFGHSFDYDRRHVAAE
jgi:hypothetical protein